MGNRHLYRGKRAENGEWVEWNILEGIPHDAHILKSTICQCTGYKGIYERDIFQCDDSIYVIVWSNEDLCWEALSVNSSESIALGEFAPEEIDIIGNEIDNPKLLEV